MIYVDPSGHVPNIGPDEKGQEQNQGDYKGHISSVAELGEAVEKGEEVFQRRLEEYDKSKRKALYDLDGNLKGYKSPIANTWDPITNKNILSLDPYIQAQVTTMVNFLDEIYDIQVRVSCACRSLAQQEEEWMKGRITGILGAFSTKAPPGYSAHNYGLAFDIDVIKGANYNTGLTLASSVGIGLGLQWGGNFDSIYDPRHFELTNQYKAARNRAGFTNALRDSWGRRCLSQFRENSFL